MSKSRLHCLLDRGEPFRSALGPALLVMLNAVTLVNAEEKKPGPAAEERAREALAKFDRQWKDYQNEPNFGDPRWKLKMETLVQLARAGGTAVAALEEAAREDSPRAPHTRELAAEVLRAWRDAPAVREAWADYELSRMDSAKEGEHAPDFTLADASGRNYRLSRCRGKNTVVLTFIIQDI
jgi:hypothetical protein